jgi:pyruvate dehydrogenase E1 component alpha subunit
MTSHDLREAKQGEPHVNRGGNSHLDPAERERLLDALRRMAKVRLAEQCISAHYPEQKMRCPAHLCIGQEGTAAAFGVAARSDDAFLGNYRSHGHYLAKGGSLVALFAELLGFENGCSSGLGGSMHVLDESCGFFGSSAIVSATIPIAAGLALGFKTRKEPRVALVFFGDAALEEGATYETVNFAVLHKLPVVLVCENNGLAVSTPLDLRTSAFKLFERFAAFGLPGERVAGEDLPGMLRAADRALERARSGGGPSFIECMVTRMGVHVGHQIPGPVDLWASDPEAAAQAKCPLGTLAHALVGAGWIDLAAVRELREKLKAQIEEAFVEASRGTVASADQVARSVYASGELSRIPGARVQAEPAREAREPSKLVNPF